MANNDASRLGSRSDSWRPADELVESNLAILKLNHCNLWSELKALESKNGNPENVTGEGLLAAIIKNNSQLNSSQIVIPQHHVRMAARKELGL